MGLGESTLKNPTLHPVHGEADSIVQIENLSKPPHPIVFNMVTGTIRVFLCEVLILPVGFIMVVFLGRKLGADGYGVFTLSAAIVAWIAWSISSVFARATVKFVSEATDWRAVGTMVKRLHLVASCLAMILLWVLAEPIAGLLNESVLITYLRLFAIDIPIFSLAHVDRNVLIGLGGYKERSLMSAGRWLTKLILIVFLVEIGLSVPGAILGSIGASIVEFVVGRSYLRLSPFGRSCFPARQLFSYAVPLFFFALSVQVYYKMDLMMLKILGGSIEQAGIYGAAQNLSVVPSIFALSFSPLLLSTLNRILHTGNGHVSKALGRDAMRVVICLLPFAGMTAGASQEMVVLIFGRSFAEAGPLLGCLIFAGLAMVMTSVTTAILTAAGKPGWTFGLTGPLVPLAFWGHLVMIPKFGSIGAALVTTFFSLVSVLTTILGIHRIWQVLPPIATLIRSSLICGAAFAFATLWDTPGPWVLFKLWVIIVFIPLAFFLTGEFTTREIAFVRSLLRWRSATE
jgi:O-antigen/teichoic acid export membrane protein